MTSNTDMAISVIKAAEQYAPQVPKELLVLLLTLAARLDMAAAEQRGNATLH